MTKMIPFPRLLDEGLLQKPLKCEKDINSLHFYSAYIFNQLTQINISLNDILPCLMSSCGEQHFASLEET